MMWKLPQISQICFQDAIEIFDNLWPKYELELQ